MNVLVIIDVQNDFVNGSLGTPEAQQIVPKVVDLVKDWKGDIYYTYDTHDESYLKTHEGINLPVEHCIKGTEGWAYPTELYNALVEHDKTEFKDGEYVGVPHTLKEIRNRLNNNKF